VNRVIYNTENNQNYSSIKLVLKDFYNIPFNVSWIISSNNRRKTL